MLGIWIEVLTVNCWTISSHDLMPIKEDFVENFGCQCLGVLEENIAAFQNLKRQSKSHKQRKRPKFAKILYVNVFILISFDISCTFIFVRGFSTSKKFLRRRKINRLSLGR